MVQVVKSVNFRNINGIGIGKIQFICAFMPGHVEGIIIAVCISLQFLIQINRFLKGVKNVIGHKLLLLSYFCKSYP